MLHGAGTGASGTRQVVDTTGGKSFEPKYPPTEGGHKTQFSPDLPACTQKTEPQIATDFAGKDVNIARIDCTTNPISYLIWIIRSTSEPFYPCVERVTTI